MSISKLSRAEYYDLRLKAMDPGLVTSGVHIIKMETPPGVLEWVNNRITIHGLLDWIEGYHSTLGMDLRNMLRESGLDDSMLPDLELDGIPGQNWDDYYVQIVEIAAGARDNPNN